MLTEKQKQGLLLGRKKGLVRNRPSGLKYVLLKENPTSFKKGQHPSPKTEFKEGQTSWNRGINGTHFGLKTEFKVGQFTEEKHPFWKGENVGYVCLHIWVRKHLGKANHCVVCGLNDPKRRYNWANIDHKYRRKTEDFISLCVPCHRKHDKNL